MSFGNPIVGGAGALIRTAVKSPNYTPGVAGWSINRDGTAEFNGATVRGDLVVGTPPATRIIEAGADAPAELAAFCTATYGASIVQADIRHMDANNYRYDITLNLAGGFGIAGGWRIVNQHTSAIVIWEEYITTIPEIDGAGNVFAPAYFFGSNAGHGGTNTYEASYNTDSFGDGSASISYHCETMGVVAFEQRVDPTTLGLATTTFNVVPGSAISFQNPQATPNFPYNWTYIGMFDVQVTTAAVGPLAQCAIALDGVKSSKWGQLDMRALTRDTITVIAHGTISDGNSHTWDMRAQKSAAGGVGAVQTENTGNLIIVQY